MCLAVSVKFTSYGGHRISKLKRGAGYDPKYIVFEAGLQAELETLFDFSDPIILVRDFQVHASGRHFDGVREL
jgi:hypothetical protein